MSEFRRGIYAICATSFAILYLTSIIIWGHPVARAVAIAAALIAVASQFLAQDDSPAARTAHMIASYLGFLVALVAFIAFITEA